MEYRSESKYIVKDTDLEILKYRIENLMSLDVHTEEENFYNVRSIYFDDYKNTFYYENEDGVNERMKIRIRIYNKSPDFIQLEIKYKKNGMTKKESTKISKELCERLMRGEFISLSECNSNKVLYKLYLEEQLHNLKPKIIVEYDRVAYTKGVGNVRVTFDKNIRASKYIERFFEDRLYATPILDDGAQILEIKYDELLPDYIRNTLELNTLKETTFSKYYLSRLQFKEEVI